MSDIENAQWFANFEFLEKHPLYKNKTSNHYGMEYRFEDGYIHILNINYAQQDSSIVHYGLFGSSYDHLSIR